MNKLDWAERIAEELTKYAHYHDARHQEDGDICRQCGGNFRLHLAVGETLKTRIAATLRRVREADAQTCDVIADRFMDMSESVACGAVEGAAQAIRARGTT